MLTDRAKLRFDRARGSPRTGIGRRPPGRRRALATANRAPSGTVGITDDVTVVGGCRRDHHHPYASAPSWQPVKRSQGVAVPPLGLFTPPEGPWPSAVAPGTLVEGLGRPHRLEQQSEVASAVRATGVAAPAWLPLPPLPASAVSLDPNLAGAGAARRRNHGVGACLTSTPWRRWPGRAMHLDRPVAVLTHRPRVVAAGRPSDPSRSGAIRASREGGGCRLQAGCARRWVTARWECRRLCRTTAHPQRHATSSAASHRLRRSRLDAGAPIAPGRYCWGRARTAFRSRDGQTWASGSCAWTGWVRLKALPISVPVPRKTPSVGLAGLLRRTFPCRLWLAHWPCGQPARCHRCVRRARGRDAFREPGGVESAMPSLP